MAFATLSVDFVASMAKFEDGMTRASKSVDGLGNRFISMGRTASAALAGLGIGIGVGGLAAVVKSAIDAQDAISKLSQRTGIAVETLAGLEHAAELSGIEVEQLGKGVRTFSVLVDQAAQGQKSYQDKLTSLGLNYKELRALSPEEQFYKLADAVSRLGKEDRAAAVAGALGDRLSVLVPLLSGGADEMRKLVEEGQRFNPVTAESARRAEEFNDNLSRLEKEAGLAGIELATNLLPSLADTAQAMVDLSREGHGVLAMLRGFAGIGKLPFDLLIGEPFKPLANASEHINELRNKLNDLQRDLKSAETGGKSSKVMRSIFGTPEEIQQQITVIRNQIAVLEKFGDKIYKPKVAVNPGGGSDTAAQIACVSSGGTWDGRRCVAKQTIGSKSDPLASLLGSTDIGKLKEFDKTVALLNARFDGGRKNTELYNQAMTRLVETTFSNNWKQAANDAEFFRMVEADGIKTTLEWKQNLDDLANVDMSRLTTLLDNTDFSRLKKSQEDMVLLAKAFTEGIKDADGNLRKLSESEYLDAVANRLGLATDKVEELDTFAKRAAENIQDGFANFFKNFDKGTNGMLKSFGETIKGMIAEAASADLTKWLFGDLVKGGSGSGVAGGLLRQIGGVFDGGTGSGQNLLGDFASLFGFATGGSFAVGGAGGTDSQLVAFRATPGELVDVRTPGQAKSGGSTIIQNFYGTKDPQETGRAAGRGARDALAMIDGARRYG